jgi:hypothetical protein
MEHVAAQGSTSSSSVRDAHDAVFAALSSDDATEALRAAAIDLAGRGWSRQEIEAVFASVCDELGLAGRDEEAAVIGYVLDMIAEW